MRVHKYKGASARGLGNPRSTLQVGPQVLDSLRRLPPDAQVLLLCVVCACSCRTDCSSRTRSSYSSSACLCPLMRADLARSTLPSITFVAAELARLTRQLYALETGSLDAAAEPEVFADRVADAYFAWLLGAVFEIARSLRLRIGLSSIIAPIVADDALSRVLIKYTRESERDNSATSAREDALLSSPSKTARENDPMLGMSAREDAALANGGRTAPLHRIEDLLAREPSPCSMAARRRMVRRFNSRLADFCTANPSFRLVDINDGALEPSGAVRAEYVRRACDALADCVRLICRDPLNIHPLYEPSASAHPLSQADRSSAAAMGACA